MRRAASLGVSRLLASLLPPGAACSGLRALPAAVCALSELQQPSTGCRAAHWAPQSPWRAGGSSRALATAIKSDSGHMKQFRLAQTGEGIKECELVQWYVAEGDAVEEFGKMCEVQSDKATIEITSPFAGVVKKLHHTRGDVVQVGDVLADIHVEGVGPDIELHSPPLEAPQAPAVAAGAAAAAAAVPAAGERQQEGGKEDSAAAAQRQQPPVDTASSSSEGGGADGASRVLTSPAVRKLARDYGISLTQVQATGPGNRVTKADVQAHLAMLGEVEAGMVTAVQDAAAPATAVEAAVAPHVAQLAPAVIQLRGYRKAMVKSMTAAAHIPHFHFCEEVQMDALVELRERLRGDPSLAGGKLTYLPFFMKAAALALRDFPLINASLAPDQGSIVQHRHVNLGIAMATPHGLVVPNIKDVQSKNVAQLAAELARLQAAAAANKLSQADISGGTFTISNIGTVGGTYATPLANPPEVAIMALGRMQRLPRFVGDSDQVVPAHIMNVSVGADHRVVDGAALAEFTRAWREYVETPARQLLKLS